MGGFFLSDMEALASKWQAWIEHKQHDLTFLWSFFETTTSFCISDCRNMKVIIYSSEPTDPGVSFDI